MGKSILAIGMDLPAVEGFEPIKLTSGRSLLDADIIAIELSLDEFGTDYGGYNGVELLTEGASATFRRLLDNWKNHINAALQGGRTVVFFLTQRRDSYYYVGTKSTSGTGRSMRTTNHVSECSNYSLLPLNLDGAAYISGNSIQFERVSDAFSSYWREFASISNYNAYFKIVDMKTLARIKGTQNTVAALLPKYGNLVLLPELRWSQLRSINESASGAYVPRWNAEAQVFSTRLRDALFQIHAEFQGQGEDTVIPQWANAPSFELVEESALKDKSHAISLKIEELVSERDATEVSMRQAGSLRKLLYASGRPLEEAVREALDIMGFNTSNFNKDGSEFDALFTSGEGRFLGEVEGKDTKPINVDKISQLQRNLTEDYARDEITEMATGVLFGNGDRQTSPEQRQTQFTDKVRQVAKIANIALVSTTSLFFVARKIRESGDADYAQACRKCFSSQVGEIVEFPPHL